MEEEEVAVRPLAVSVPREEEEEEEEEEAKTVNDEVRVGAGEEGCSWEVLTPLSLRPVTLYERRAAAAAAAAGGEGGDVWEFWYRKV